jgi:hypothetical protein
MKQTFSNKLFDYILIGLSLFYSIISILFFDFECEFFSSFILKIFLLIIPIITFISLVFNFLNSERFTIYFIILVLLFPSIYILYQFFTDLIFYSICRYDLLQNPILFINLIFGISLIYFSIKFSKKQKNERIRDYNILIIFIGLYLIFHVIIRSIEPFFNWKCNDYPNWKTLLKLGIGLLVFIVGNKMKTEKIKFKNGLVLTLILLFIYGIF